MKKETLRVGVVGLGHRGKDSMLTCTGVPGVEIVAICDLYEDRTAAANEALEKETGKKALTFKNYRDMLEEVNMDALVVFTDWQSHVKITVDAMRHGIYTGLEVGGASSIEECWRLVRAHEETGVHCMLLENANYSRESLTMLRMVKEGLFGELVYLSGAYQHDLRDEIGLGREIRHYRFPHFVKRNGELYPTHDIGPLAKYLDINRGNRFLTLSSIGSKTRGLAEYYVKNRKVYNNWVKDSMTNEYKGQLPEAQNNYDMIGKPIACADVVSTTIRCAGGEIINIIHDCTLPRPRYANNRLQGTKGIWMGDTKTIYFEDSHEAFDKWESDAKWLDKYEHPLWTEAQEKAKNQEREGGFGSHGGTDYIVLSAFFDAVKRNIAPPIDVYDTAAWMAITCLSEDSIALGGAPVAFPDFTNGLWIDREPGPESKYSLEKVCWDCFKA
ncbi:MAG: Gfo/Idh/MocA family oxidoreductase [Defluviitaleaceae bacterium]|nr:Gfo/Idh/MocA family oxidoreductase [Defluviitaleaceae bacterium]